MSRILEYIAKYDESLTIAQLKKSIELEQLSALKRETEEVNNIIVDFTDVYLKEIDEDSIFGKTLNIYYIKDFVKKERTDRWDLIYYFEGTKISFSKRDVSKRAFNPDLCGDSFNEKELRQMKIITKEEYNKYNWEYEGIIKKLNHLIS